MIAAIITIVMTITEIKNFISTIIGWATITTTKIAAAAVAEFEYIDAGRM